MLLETGGWPDGLRVAIASNAWCRSCAMTSPSVCRCSAVGWMNLREVGAAPGAAAFLTVIARSHCFKCVVSIMRDDFAVGLPLLRGGLDEFARGGGRTGCCRLSHGACAWLGARGPSERGSGGH